MRRLSFLLSLGLASACSSGSSSPSGTPDAPSTSLTSDAPQPRIDAAVAAVDAFVGLPDAPRPPDASPPPPADASSPPDAATPDAPPPPPPDAATPGAGSDPCHGITASGMCATTTSVEFCVIPEGGDPFLQTEACGAGTDCAIVDGLVECVPTTGCLNGTTECANATQIRTCVGGVFQTSTCPRQCLSTPLGAFCGLDAPTTTLTASVTYEARGPNANLTDWGTIFDAAAQGFVVLSVRVLPDNSIVPIDATVTGESDADGGSFSVQVPLTPTAGDEIFVVATRFGSDQQPLIALLDPLLAPSSIPYPVGTASPQPRLWFWSWTTSGIPQNAHLSIPESAGSGAARVFDYMRFILEIAEARWPGRPILRDLVWLGDGVSWVNCGECFQQRLTFQIGTFFGGQTFLNGAADDEFWADSVTAHELGHWAMASFGHAVGEGGTHILGQPATPGLAWSEGWATWFSSNARSNPVYFDKQQGTTFWFDISSRSASDSLWPRPAAALGRYQPIYENEISAMMWNLSETQGLTSAPLDMTLASPRMTIPPFLRGYLTPQGVNTTMFADFLDALRCGGIGPGTIDIATDPLVHYPYPSLSPLCALQAPSPPATLGVELVDGRPVAGGHIRLRAHLTVDPTWPFPVSFSFQPPSRASVTRVQGIAATIGSAPEIELDLADVPDGDLVAVADSQGKAGGFHAEARYRFGRPAPLGRVPLRTGPSLHLGSLELGAPIRGTVR